MIVAITGANGFIGRRVVQQFVDAGHEVRPIVRRDFADGSFAEAIRGADVVIHAAGATRAPSRGALRRANVELTSRAIDAARAGQVRRFVFVSSQAAAGPASFRDKPITETDAPAPIDEYGRTKRDAELLVRGAGIPFTIVRPAAVYGPGDRDFLGLFRLARRGWAIHPGNRSQWISLVHVDDVARAMLCAAEAPAAAGGTYFVANERPAQWSGLYALAAAASGRGVRFEIDVAPMLVRLGALGGDLFGRLTGRAPLLTTEKVALARPRYWLCSNRRAVADLAFTETYTLERGFSETLRWYMSNGWLEK